MKKLFKEFWIQKTYKGLSDEVISEREFTVKEKLQIILIIIAYLLCASILLLPFFQ